MWIDPFVAGILSTITVEFVLLTAIALWRDRKNRKEK